MVKYLIKFVNFINVGEIVGLELPPPPPRPPRLPLCFFSSPSFSSCLCLSFFVVSVNPDFDPFVVAFNLDINLVFNLVLNLVRDFFHLASNLVSELSLGFKCFFFFEEGVGIGSGIGKGFKNSNTSIINNMFC